MQKLNPNKRKAYHEPGLAEKYDFGLCMDLKKESKKTK